MREAAVAALRLLQQLPGRGGEVRLQLQELQHGHCLLVGNVTFPNESAVLYS